MNPLLTANISIGLSSPVVLVCQLFLVAVNFYLLMSVCRNKCDGIKHSLAFVFSVFFTFFYQIPSVLYGSFVIQNMPEPIWFLAVINIVPITLGVWLASTKSFFLGGKTKIESAKEKYGFSRDERRSILILAFTSTFCIGTYLYLIPFRCTGLWAMINDPEAVLLARELSMKLNGYPMVNRIYGFYINIIAPLVCFFGIYFSYRFFRQRFFFASLLWLFVAGIVIPTFYIGGIKGALANAIIFIVVSIMSTPQIMRAKVIMAFASIIVFVGSVLLFELARDRANGDINHEYNFAACAKGFASCEEASSLIKSAGIRPEGSLGLRPFRIEKYRTQLNQTCSNLESATIKINNEPYIGLKNTEAQLYYNYKNSRFPIEFINSAIAGDNKFESDFGNSNKILNGDFAFWNCDRETYNGSAYRYGCANMWRYTAKGGRVGETTLSKEVFNNRVLDIPGGVNYLRWAQTKGTDVGWSVALSQQVHDAKTFEGKTVTLSFYARAASDRALVAQLIQNVDGEGTGSAHVFPIVRLTQQWVRYERTLVLPLLDKKKGRGSGYLDLVFTESSAEPFVIDIARIQLEEGNRATSFYSKPRELERMEIESAEQSRALASPLPRPRIFELFEASMVRLFRVPFQVSTWHFINASADSSIRWSAIPLLNRFDTARRNLSEEVYQKFGAFYSGGDVTSTSTAPTSFVLQYSAYLGLAGLFLSLILIIAADTVSRFFYQRLSSPLIFGFSGYVVTVAYNMISSDFFTVLFSHGAFLGFCFFYFLSGCSNLTKFRQRV